MRSGLPEPPWISIGKAAMKLPVKTKVDGYTVLLARTNGELVEVVGEAPATADQITKIRFMEDDVDARNLALLNVSQIFENSFVVNEIDPALWFNIVRDESNIRYAVAQLTADYRDLDQAMGGRDPRSRRR